MKRYLSLLLVGVTLLLLFCNWLVDPTFGEEIAAASYAELREDAGIPLSEQEMDRLIAQLQDGWSPYDVVCLLGIAARSIQAEKKTMTADEIATYDYNGMLVLAYSMIALFYLIVLGLIKLLVQHVFGRRPRGVLTFLMLLLMVSAFVAYSIMNRTVTVLPALYLAPVSMLVSCICWGAEIRAHGARTGQYTLEQKTVCKRCKAPQTIEGNMFCEKCGELLDC